MQLPGLATGIIADDLTGANDTGLEFFLAGCNTHVLFDLNEIPAIKDVREENPDRPRVWVFNTESRYGDIREAISIVRRSVAKLQHDCEVEHFYKKIDSTLRGHVAQECLEMLDELKWDCAVVAPAFPQQKRQTVGGYQLLRGIPIEQTEVAREPLSPVRQSHVPTLLGEASNPDIVGYIELSVVLHGAGPLLNALNEQIQAGKKLVVVDACSSTDLDQIALAIEKIHKTAKILPCGSAGLARALSKFWSGDSDEERPEETPELPTGPILIVAGSNSETTRTQIRQLIENYTYYGESSELTLIDLPPASILDDAPWTPWINQVVSALGTQNAVVLSTSFHEQNLGQTLALAEEREMSTEQATRQAQEALAQITKGVLEAKPSKLVLCGGETATHVTRTLGFSRLDLVAKVEPSIPLMEGRYQDGKRQWMVTKSGNFGIPMTLANVVKFLKQHEVVTHDTSN